MRSAALENAIVNAITQGRNGLGAVVIFASGNFGVIDYPAWFHPDILVVGAVDRHGRRSVFDFEQSSGFGTQLDVVAPGSNILSTLPGNQIGEIGGTSMAAPHVAGVAALMLSVNPLLSARQVRDIIKGTANRYVLPGVTFGNTPERPTILWNNQVGHGLLDAYAAVRAAPYGLVIITPPPPPPTISGSATIHAGESGTFTVSNVPPGAIVTWANGANLQRISATGNRATFRAGNNTGTSWIQATVNGVSSERFNVTISRPPFDDIRIGNPSASDPFSRNLCRNVNHTLLAHSSRGIYTGIGSFFWRFGAWTPYITGFSPSLVNNAHIHFRLGNNATFVQVVTVVPLAPGEPPPSDFDLPITYIGDTFYIVNCFGRDLPLTVEHPNPVSSILPIQIVPHPQLALARNMRNAFGLQYNVRLYDREGNVVRQLTTEREQFQLDVSDLPDGYYYLHILDEAIDAPIVQQIIVRNRRL